jgi:rod shape-determining protein MreC
MKQYLNFGYKKSNLSIQQSFNLVIKKIEVLLLSFLCIICIIASKTSVDFVKEVSFVFIGISTPIVNTISFPFNSTIGILTDFSDLVQAKKENIILKEELQKMRSHYISILNIHQENKDLKQALNFVKDKSTNYRVAQVIGWSHQLFNNNVIIDAGTSRGIREGNMVVGEIGVVGRIEHVEKTRSRLILINDSTSRIPVMISNARVRGILVGNNSNLMEIIYSSKGKEIEVGDMVYTSGDGDTLPSGLFIGRIKKIENNIILVSMVEDIANLNFVTIIDY